MAEGGGDVLITPGQRRSILRDHALRRRTQEQLRQQVHARAGASVGMGSFASLPWAAPGLLPFQPHPSHEGVLCGGFLGCNRCGSVMGFHQRGPLVEPCRGSCPAGSVRPVRRLIQGRPPHGDGEQWPSGEANPRPLRVRSVQAASPRSADVAPVGRTVGSRLPLWPAPRGRPTPGLGSAPGLPRPPARP